jgi:hypothetical protein
MSYGPLHPSPIRIIDLDSGRVMRPFEARWVCDPCAPPNRRYRVRYSIDSTPTWIDMPWFALITRTDDHRTRVIKWAHVQRIIAARDALDRAEAAYRRLAQ